MQAAKSEGGLSRGKMRNSDSGLKCQAIVELCNIRDGLSFCNDLNYSNIICTMNTLCLQYIYICIYVNTFDHLYTL